MLDLKAVAKAVEELEEDVVLNLLNDFMEMNPTREEAQKVISACQQGMAVVGDLFEKGDYFVGELIFAGELLAEVTDVLKPAMGAGSTLKVGSILLGTVHGDLHDIGKNIFKSMVQAAGFEVYDLGIDQPIQAFVDRAKEINPDVIGMSGVLTLALESMKETVDALKKAGVRDSIKIIIGGSSVTKEACEYIGADDFTTNADEGVRIVQEWMKEKSLG